MKKIRPIIYLIIAIATAGVILLVERPDSFRVNDTSLTEFIPDYDSANVARVEVEQLIDGAELKRNGDEWQVASFLTPSKKELIEKGGGVVPQSKWHKADRARVNSALGIFSGLEKGILVSRNPQKQNLYHAGVSGLKVRLYDKKDNLISAVVIGKNGPDFASSYVRQDTDNNVWLVHRPIMGAFTPRANDWRERKIWSVKPDEIEELEVSSGKSRLHLTKGEDGQWKDDSPKMKIVPEEKIKEVIGKLSEFSAADFTDEANFDKPFLSLTLAYSGGKTLRLAVAKSIDVKSAKKSGASKYYAKLDGADDIYILSKETVDSIPVRVP